MMKPKILLFFLFAFLLFAVDVGCTYNTFAIRGVPIAYEVNTVFRDWVIQDGWAISIGKFTVLKTALFSLCGWLIFKTRNRLLTFILAQCAITNHLVAISSHPTLWWMTNFELRTLVLWAVGLLSLLLTFFGIRYLRLKAPEALVLQSRPQSYPYRPGARLFQDLRHDQAHPVNCRLC